MLMSGLVVVAALVEAAIATIEANNLCQCRTQYLRSASGSESLSNLMINCNATCFKRIL